MKRCAVLKRYSFDIMMCNWVLFSANLIKIQPTDANKMWWREKKKSAYFFQNPQLQPENQASLAFLKKDIDQYSSCPSATGLWLSSVTIVWHAAGDEGAIRGNSAEKMEYHLQVQCDVQVAHWWEFLRVYLRACLHIQRGHVALTFPFSVIRVQRVLGPLHTLARVGLWETSSSWFWSFTTSQREEVF